MAKETLFRANRLVLSLIGSAIAAAFVMLTVWLSPSESHGIQHFEEDHQRLLFGIAAVSAVLLGLSPALWKNWKGLAFLFAGFSFVFTLYYLWSSGIEGSNVAVKILATEVMFGFLSFYFSWLASRPIRVVSKEEQEAFKRANPKIITD